MEIGSIVPLFIRTCDLLVRAWFWTVENLDVYVLQGTSFIDGGIRPMFPTARKIVLWHLKPVETILIRTAIYSINDYIRVLDGNTHIR